jgi:hypothetical protein
VAAGLQSCFEGVQVGPGRRDQHLTPIMTRLTLSRRQDIGRTVGYQTGCSHRPGQWRRTARSNRPTIASAHAAIAAVDRYTNHRNNDSPMATLEGVGERGPPDAGVWQRPSLPQPRPSVTADHPAASSRARASETRSTTPTSSGATPMATSSRAAWHCAASARRVTACCPPSE